MSAEARPFRPDVGCAAVARLRRRGPWLAALAAVTLAAAVGAAPRRALALPLHDTDNWRLVFSGSYHNFADVLYYATPPLVLVKPEPAAAAPAAPEGHVWGSDFQSIRLMLGARISRYLLFEIHYLHTLALAPPPAELPVFGPPNIAAGRFVDLEWQAYNGPRLHWTHALDRLNLTLRIPVARPIRLTFGRQDTNYSIGRYWHALDRLAPFAPFETVRDYKPGLDGVRIQVPLGPYTTLDLLYLAGDALAETTFHTRVAVQWAGFQFAAMAGWVRGDGWFGVQAEGAPWGIGLGAEIGYGLDPDGPDWVSALVRGEYRFGFGLEFDIEAYVHTGGAASASGYTATAASPRYRALEFFNLGRYYTALGVQFPLPHSLRLGVRTLFAWQDVSAYLNPYVAYAVSGGAEVIVRTYIPLGARPEDGEPRSEYGSLPNVYTFEARFDF